MPNALQGLLADPRGEMQATPRRNKIAGLLFDALSAANDYAQKQDPTMPGGRANPVLGLLADAAGLQSAATTAGRVAYGEPLTNGLRGSKAFLKPETADVAMMAPISPRNALAALGLAGGVADGGVAKAIFAGVGAKTADKAALAQAEKMTAAGADQRQVWTQTGWFKGGDGKWRFEIDDAGFKVNDWRATGGGLSPEHPGLGNAYDGTHRLKVRPDDRLDAGTMGYAPWKDNLDFRMGDHGTIVYKPGEKPPADAWLHELQHYVQAREGFQNGGNPKEFATTVSAQRDIQERIRRAAEQAMTATDEVARSNAMQEMAFYRSKLDPKLKGLTPSEAYERLAGEAEARAVQARMNMTPAQRRATFPLDSYDVPVDQLIYK